MAARKRRGKKNKTRTKYKSAFNIRAAGIAYISLALSTNAILRVSPYEFLAAGYIGGEAGAAAMSQEGAITLKELIAGTQLMSSYSGDPSAANYSGTTEAHSQGRNTIGATMKRNIMENGIPLIFAQIGLVAADKLAQNFGIYRSFNKTVRSIGMGNLVKA